MGLFSKKETCCICNRNEGAKKIANGMVCNPCLAQCGPFIPPFGLKNKSSEHILQAMQINARNNNLLTVYHCTRNVEKYFEIDEQHNFWKAPCFLPNVVFLYDEMVRFELLENGNPITKGGIGSAVVGGAIFGGVGAIVGSNVGKKKTKQEITEFRIKIVTKNPCYPEVYINFLNNGNVKQGGILYNSYSASAQQILSLLAIMADVKSTPDNTASSNSAADEILKLKNLMDNGIITQAEFEQKKAQLLGL